MAMATERDEAREQPPKRQRTKNAPGDMDLAAIDSELDRLALLARDLEVKRQTNLEAGVSDSEVVERVADVDLQRKALLVERAARIGLIRGAILADAASGALAPHDAEPKAEQEGAGALFVRDIEFAANWTLAMAVAWIAWRNSRDVTWQWVPALKGVMRWEKHAGGYVPAPVPVPTVAGLKNRVTTAGGGKVYGVGYGQLFSIEDALQRLVEALMAGKLQADAEPTPVPPPRWATMSIHPTPSGDELRSTSDSSNYRKITIPRADVLVLWPSRAAANASSANATHNEDKTLLYREVVAKTFPNGVPVTLGKKERNRRINEALVARGENARGERSWRDFFKQQAIADR